MLVAELENLHLRLDNSMKADGIGGLVDLVATEGGHKVLNSIFNWLEMRIHYTEESVVVPGEYE